MRTQRSLGNTHQLRAAFSRNLPLFHQRAVDLSVNLIVNALTRQDMTAFLSWLRVKVPDNNTRNLIVGANRRNVAFARRHLAKSGQAAEQFGGGFQLYHEDAAACRSGAAVG